jgi:multiple sugar transport system permease protein
VRTSQGRSRSRHDLAGYAFVSPAVVLFVVFIGGPFLAAIVLSAFRWDLLTEVEFVGWENVAKVVTDTTARTAILNTFVFAVASVVTHIGIGLALAIGVDRRMHGGLRYFLRTAYFFPFLISWAAVALLWKYVLDPTFGIATHYLQQLGLPTANWLTSPVWAMPALIVVDLWHTIGFTFVILLAGLQSIPPHLYEAALIDGAGPWQRFWHVTVPMLSPTLFFATVITFIGAFQIFEPMFIMTEGGPLGRTESIVMHTYETAFRNFDVGYASTLTLVIFVVMMVVTLVQFRLSRRWVHQ